MGRIRRFAVFFGWALVLSGCAQSGLVRNKEDVGLVDKNAFEHEARDRVAALHDSYVSGLREIFADSRTSLDLKSGVAIMLSREGDPDALAWLARGFREAKGLHEIEWAFAIRSAVLQQTLIAQLAQSDDADKNLAAALLLTIIRMPEECQHLPRILQKNSEDALTVRMALIALATNSTWKEGLPHIAQLTEGADVPPAARRGAAAALARFVGEAGEMTIAEFRSYVKARLKEMQETPPSGQ